MARGKQKEGVVGEELSQIDVDRRTAHKRSKKAERNGEGEGEPSRFGRREKRGIPQRPISSEISV